jgi:hypothetical protein
MDLHTFQENWSVICRKFPLVCFINHDSSDIDSLKQALISHCSQFNHVIVLSQNTSSDDLTEFCKEERIINLTCLKTHEIPGNSLEEKIINTARGQMLIVSSKLSRLERNMRWEIYDRVKEMKSPLTDVIYLDNNSDYCDPKNSSLTVNLRLS